MKTISLSILCCLLILNSWGQALTGSVYDASSNTGIKNFRVSDGKNIVLTDAKGFFKLPGHPKQRFVFITPADGYHCTDSFYIRIDSNRTSYNFALRKDEQGRNHRKGAKFLRLTDTETYLYGNWINETRDFAKLASVDFIVHTGDICYEKGMQFHARQVNTRTMGVPVYYCVGNHDLVKGAYGEALYESLFGPVYYSFEYGNTHFIVTPMRYGDYKPSYTVDDIYDWLQNDLKYVTDGKHVVIFNHDLWSFDSLFTVKNSHGDVLNLNEHRLKAWIYGHWHYNYSHEHGKNGIVSVCSAPAADGGIDNSISNFDVFDIDEQGNLDVKRRYSYVDNKITVVSPAKKSYSSPNGNLQINANIYETDDLVDGATFRLYDMRERLIAVIPLKQSGDWSWVGEIPRKQLQNGTGTYQGTVEANMLSGKWIFSRDTFELMPRPKLNIQNNWETALENNSRLPAIKDPRFTAFKLLWTQNTGANIWKSSPLIINGKLYLSTIDDENRRTCKMVCLNALDGSVIWEFKTGNSIKNSLAYAGGKILGTDVDGISYALDAKSGKLVWKHDGGMKSLPPYNGAGLVYNDEYITGSGNYFQALNIKNGAPVWTNKVWNGGEATPSAMTLFKDMVITSSNWNRLYAHSLKNGKLQWSRKDGGIRFRSGTPTTYKDRLFVQGINMLHVLDLDGKTIDSIPVKGDLKTMTATAISGDQLWIPTAADGLMMYQLSTKEKRYTFMPGEAISYSAPYSRPPAPTIESTPLVAGKYLFVAACDGKLYALDKDSGKVIDTLDLGAPIYADMTIVDGILFVADFSGNISAIGLNENL